MHRVVNADRAKFIDSVAIRTWLIVGEQMTIVKTDRHDLREHYALPHCR